MSIPNSANVALVPLPRDVEDRLRTLDPGLTGPTALILPTQTRGGQTYYVADDVEAVRAARTVGLEARFIQSSDERRYLNEFATGWELEMALAVAQNLAANGIGSLIAYVWERARLAIQRGRHPGPETEVPVRLTIAQLDYEEQGRVKITGLEITGTAQETTTLMQTILAGPTAAQAQLASGRCGYSSVSAEERRPPRGEGSG